MDQEKTRVQIVLQPAEVDRLSALAWERGVYLSDVLQSAVSHYVACNGRGDAVKILSDYRSAGSPNMQAPPGRPRRRAEEAGPAQFERGYRALDPRRAYEGTREN